jgi:hypothetical protein
MPIPAGEPIRGDGQFLRGRARPFSARPGGCSPPAELVILVIAVAGFVAGIVVLATGAITIRENRND